MGKHLPLNLTPSQSKTLRAIFDTFVAELTPEEEQALVTKFEQNQHLFTIDASNLSTYAKLSASKTTTEARTIEFIENCIDPDKRLKLIRVLDLLSTKPGSLLFTGYFTPFAELTRPQREKVLLQWKTASLVAFRALYNVFAGLCFFNTYTTSDSEITKCIAYDAAGGDTFFETHADYQPVEHERIPMMSTQEAISGTLEFDAIVVGSGAGGGVVAAELAQAGFSVLVIEKGKYYHQSEIVQQEEVAYRNMYDSGSATLSTNGSVQCLAGGTLGGGTALNYLVSLKPQHFVREEWAKLGLPHFISPKFNDDLDRVFERIGASTENILPTKTIEKFALGCDKLGYALEPVPVNTGGRAHYCSRCMMGCKSGIKNSTANTWLLDALKNGARFMDRTTVTRVLRTKGGKTAIGVECCVHDSQQTTTIKAKQVIISCGALNTPTILRNSGLSNPNIGKHLRLQPINFSFGFFDEPINQNKGPLITHVCNVSDNCQGDNYGAKIEEGSLLPGTLANKLPWLGAAKHKELILRRDCMVSLLNVIRDKDSIGTVEYDKSSSIPVYDYSLSKHDELSLTICIERNVKILAAAGAREIYTGQANVKPFTFRQGEKSSVDNPRFIKWLESVRKGGILTTSTALISVHQLGSCRMGITPKLSVVQPTGETWEVKNLHVADGSVFPTAVGVNPMVTIEAIALDISRSIISKMKNTSRL
ncbi:hypothetical protein HPULCUR_004196 [Helicostylum pulchrum]|uniref:Long-chain-alcohol oxidase n=1 Tax=Helicostylum pulchrum TaxID=562976 RepID=A0ABP9XWP0_9FUNG